MSNRSNTITNGYISQSFASIECTWSNLSNAIRNGYACQAAAIIECIFSNRSNTIANDYTCQCFATIECIISNRSNAIGNGCTCQVAAFIECFLSDRSNRTIKFNYPLLFVSIVCIRYNICSKSIGFIWCCRLGGRAVGVPNLVIFRSWASTINLKCRH